MHLGKASSSGCVSQLNLTSTQPLVEKRPKDVSVPIDLDALITMAHKYEVQYNKAPKTEVTTLFQVASGGLSEDPQKLKSELKHLKREAKRDELLIKPSR